MGYRLDDKNIKLTGKRLTKIKTEKTGDVYRYKNLALKIFKKDKPTPMDVETADYLTDISTRRIPLPINLLFYNNSFRGYTYKFPSKKGTGNRMIMLPKDELISNISVIEEDIETLSKKKVLLDGIEPNNSIFNGNLFLTDPTYFSVLDLCSTVELEAINKYQFHLLLTTLIIQELRKGNLSSKSEKELRALFDMKDADCNSSKFIYDMMGSSENIKQFVKKM